MIKLCLGLILALSVLATAHADEVITDCHITAEKTPAVSAPRKFTLSNNLRRKTGMAMLAAGEPIYLRGVVTDEECVPLSNAKIYLWQADSEGTYSSVGDPNFAGSGVTVTDNMGRYEFISVLPGQIKGRRLVYLRIAHPELGTIETEIDLAAVGTPDGPVRLASPGKGDNVQAEPIDRSHPSSGTEYVFNIALPGKDSHRRF